MIYIALAAALAIAPADTLTLKTGSPTGSYRVLGQAITDVVHDAAPGIPIRLLLSSGSVENVRALATGDADFAIVQSDIAYFAARGLEAFAGRPLRDLRAVVALHPEDILVIARRDLGLTGASGIQPGHRVVVGEAGSGTIANARNVLEAMGLPLELLDTIMRDPRQSLPLLSTGDVDVIFLTAGVSGDFLAEIEANGGALVPLATELIETLQRQHPYYEGATLQVDGRPIETLRIRALLLSHQNTPEREVQEITRAIYDNLSRIRASHPRAQDIFPASLSDRLPIAQHRGARQYLCDRGDVSCDWGFGAFVLVLVLLGLGFASLAVSARARKALLRLTRGWGHTLVGPHSVTDRYRYILVPVLMSVLLVTGAFTIQWAEGHYAQERNIPSDFEDVGVNENLIWTVVFTATGFEDGRFPNSPMGKLASAMMKVIAISGVLLFIGLVTSEHIARKIRMSQQIDPATLRQHVIVCGWNERAPGVIRSLVDQNLAQRQQKVVVLADRAESLLDTHDLPLAYTGFVRGHPSSLANLEKAGLKEADTVVILADDSVPIEDRDARSLLVLIQVEKRTYGWTKSKERDREVHSIVELVQPENRDVMEQAHANQIICQTEFDQKLLVQSILNPGLRNFMQEILTVDEDNEVIEVPVTGLEVPPFKDLTFDQALELGRKEANALLLAIHKDGAPGALNGDGPHWKKGERQMLTNPFRDNEVRYTIKAGDSLLFIAESEQKLEKIFGASSTWRGKFHDRERVREARLAPAGG